MEKVQETQTPRGRRMPTDILFLINGVAALLGYNALLTSLDYFSFVYKGYDVYTLFLPPVFLGYVIIVLSYKWLSYKFSYTKLVTAGIILCNISLLMFLLLSLTCRDAKGFGFGMSIIACLLLGIGANLYQLTFFAEINYLSESVVSRFTIGTAVSGLFITTLRMIIVAIAGTNKELSFPIILYFIIAILFNFFTLFSNLTFFRSRQYKTKILPYIHRETEQGEEALQQEQKSLQNQNDGEKEQDVGYFKILYLTFKSIFPYPAIIFFNYIITFLVFPNLTTKKTYDGLDFTWSSLIFFMMYNIGDTVGKYLCDNRSTFNSSSVIYMFASRSYFVIVIPLLATTLFNDDSLINNYIFPYFVQFLFAFSNGAVTNSSFILSYQNCPMKYKKYAGVLDGIMLQIGILVGTNLAIPFSMLFVSNSG